MPTPDSLARTSRSIRLLRLASALSIIAALTAVAVILNGGPASRSQLLIAIAVLLGAGALIAMAALTVPHLRKDQNDPRS